MDGEERLMMGEEQMAVGHGAFMSWTLHLYSASPPLLQALAWVVAAALKPPNGPSQQFIFVMLLRVTTLPCARPSIPSSATRRPLISSLARASICDRAPRARPANGGASAPDRPLFVCSGSEAQPILIATLRRFLHLSRKAALSFLSMRLHCGSLATRALTGGDASWKPSILFLSWLTKVILILHKRKCSTPRATSAATTVAGARRGPTRLLSILGVGFMVTPRIRRYYFALSLLAESLTES